MTVDRAEPGCDGNMGRSQLDKVYGGPTPDVIAIEVVGLMSGSGPDETNP